MTVATIGDRPVLSAIVTEHLNGRWYAEVEIDDNVRLSGSVTLAFEGGVSFVGSVARSETFEGSTAARIVGGTGGLSSVVDAKAYRQIATSTILDDLMTDSGETLDDAVTDEVRAAYFQAWHRSRAKAAHALATLAEQLGLSWAITRAGTVWVGELLWTELDLRKYGEQLDRSDGAGWVLYAPYGAPTLQPGLTIGGLQISSVVTELSPAALVQKAFYRKSDTAQYLDRLRAGLSEFVNAILGRSADSVARWDHLALYPCTVASQADDGSLDLQPDDTVVRGSGFSGVPLKHGLPGWTASVPGGTRVLLGWEGGDPSRPYAALWNPGDVDELVFDGGDQAVAREGDSVDAGTLSGVVAGNPVTFTYVPSGGGAPIVTTTLPMTGGAITSGNDKLLA